MSLGYLGKCRAEILIKTSMQFTTSLQLGLGKDPHYKGNEKIKETEKSLLSNFVNVQSVGVFF